MADDLKADVAKLRKELAAAVKVRSAAQKRVEALGGLNSPARADAFTRATEAQKAAQDDVSKVDAALAAAKKKYIADLERQIRERVGASADAHLRFLKEDADARWNISTDHSRDLDDFVIETLEEDIKQHEGQ